MQPGRKRKERERSGIDSARRFLRDHRAFWCAVSCSLCLKSEALAADGAWNVDAAGTWITGTNWTGSVIPGATTGVTNPDIATFSTTLTVARIVTVDANRNIGGITFGNTSGFGYTLSSGSLLLSNGGVVQNLAGTGNHTDAVTTPVIIQGDGGAATFTANATNPSTALTIGAISSTTISGVSTAGNTTTLTLNGSNTNIGNIAGTLSNGMAGGKLALVKSGTGTWTIGFASNVATFTGGITISAGTLRSASTTAGQALGSGNSVTLANASGAILDISSGTTTNGIQTIGALAGGGTTGGNVTLGANTLTLGLDNSIATYAGAISGTAGITKIGTGTQTLTGTNIYIGVTRVNAGTLALDFSASSAPVTNIIAATSVLNLAGGTLGLTGKASTTNSQTFASTTLVAGSASGISLTADVTANPLLLNLGAITRGAGTTLDLSLPSGSQTATNGVRTTTANTRNGVFITASDIAYATIGGATWAGLSSGNLVDFTSAGGSYSTGVASYVTTNNVDVVDGDAPGTNFTVNTLRFNGGTKALTLSGPTNVVSTGGILVTAGTTATITGGTLRSSGTADALQFLNFGTQLTVESIVANNGSDPTVVTLVGPGTTILNGANTYTGATHVTGGTVRLGHASALGVLSALSFADRASAILELNGFDLTVGSLAGGGGQGTNGQATVGTNGGTVALGSRTLTVGGDGTNTVFGGTITGTGGSLVKVGAGSLTLHGANTFTGGVTIRAGVVFGSGVIGNNAFGTGTITLGDSAGGSAAATLRVGSSLSIVGLYTYTNPIVLAANTTGLLEITTGSSSGAMTLTGGVTGPNNLRINSSGIGGGGTLSFSTNPINNSGTLTIGGTTNSTNLAINGGIGPNVTDVILTKASAGVTNGITIGTGAVNNSGTITSTGTTLSAPHTVNSVIGTNVTGIIQSSATSALVLAGANTFRGPITVSAGSLTLSGLQSAGINSAVNIGNDASAAF
jgi:autotransporter-associated beta strand protein